jgi:hypothetical protein
MIPGAVGALDQADVEPRIADRALDVVGSSTRPTLSGQCRGEIPPPALVKLRQADVEHTFDD